MIKVGDSVWFDRTYGAIIAQVVTKVGRKWAEFGTPGYPNGGRRFDLATLIVDGNPSPGRVWLSLEERSAFMERQNAWQALRRGIDCAYSPPAGVATNDIVSAARLLGIAMPGDK